MKILDKYVAKNFLTGYAIAFCVLIGLRVIIDLFVNLDEFTERTAEVGTLEVIKNIAIYYGLNLTLYFRDFAGMITVVAASFSLGKMIRYNELIAVMASGVSLKRVIMPIIVLAIFFTGVLVVDQEFVIPPLGDKLVRSHDSLPGQDYYSVSFITDENGSLIFSPIFDVKTASMRTPTILLRKRIGDSAIWEPTGRIDADRAVYNFKTKKWDLINGVFIGKNLQKSNEKISSYSSDLTPKELPVRCKAEDKTLLSSKQLTELAAQKKKIKDTAQLYSQKHFRITDPVINFVMLMVSLPILVCRDPKAMKSAVMISFGLTGACFITTFLCKMFATEAVFGNRIIPELWAWLPIFIFFPIAFLELDSMKT